MKTKEQKRRIETDTDLFITNEIGKIFAAYAEIVYQIRCLLFHGSLAPIKENERVIRALYLTLSIVMEAVR